MNFDWISSDSGQHTLLLLLGWLSGILAVILNDYIRISRETALTKIAIRSELEEISLKVAENDHTMELNQGIVTRESLERYKTRLMSYSGSRQMREIIAEVKKWIDMSEADFQSWLSASVEKNKIIVLQKMTVPLLDTRVAGLWHLKTELQHHLLEIRAEVGVSNDLVDMSRTALTELLYKNNRDLSAPLANTFQEIYTQFAKRTKILDGLVLTALADLKGVDRMVSP